MITRHINELLTRLERVEDVGCVKIRRNELLAWYDQERLTVTIWRDIHERWEEISEKPLFVGGVEEGAEPIVFIWGDGLKDSRRSWFRDVRRLAKKMDDSSDEDSSE